MTVGIAPLFGAHRSAVGFPCGLCHHSASAYTGLYVPPITSEMLRSLLYAIAFTFLAACASTPQEVAAPGPDAAPPEATLTDNAPTEEAEERPIPDDSVYPLLLAEFALRQRAYDLALEQYMIQSEILRDPGVSAHTTHLAQYLQRETEALEAAQLWVELEPNNPEANNTLAVMLSREGRTVEALPHLVRIERSRGNANFPMLANGFDKLDTEQQRKLAGSVDDLARELPDHTGVLLTQALMKAQLEQFDQALAILEQLFALDPSMEQALLLESKILLMREDPSPFTRLEQALRDNPENSKLRLQYARLLAPGDMPAARKQFEILSAQSPRDGDLLLSLALLNRELNDNIAARAYLQQMVKLGLKPDQAHYYLGRIAEDEKDIEAALSHYRLIEGGRALLGAGQRGGLLLIEAGDLEGYLDWFEQLRDSHPASGEQLYALQADQLSQLGQPELAMTILDAALKPWPDSTSLRYSRAMLAEKLDRMTLMESDLRHILEREPDNATALNALGYTLADRTDRIEEAYQLISRALELQPTEPAILDSMGWVLYRRGQYSAALDYLTRAYEVFPDPEVAAHLGEVLWVTGNTADAGRIWEQALQKNPEARVLKDTIIRLDAQSVLNQGAPQQ